VLWEIIGVIWMNVLLSGDNALLIGLISQNLKGTHRRLALYIGIALAIVSRVVLTIVAIKLIATPYVSLVGGLTLCYVSCKMFVRSDEEQKVSSPSSLWRAIGLIAFGDIVMSLDNVLAVAGIAHQHILPVVIGLLCMVPIMLIGTKFVLWLMETIPAIVYVGALYLAWVAAQMMLNDPIVTFDATPWNYLYQGAIVCIVAMLGILFRPKAIGKAEETYGRGSQSEQS